MNLNGVDLSSVSSFQSYVKSALFKVSLYLHNDFEFSKEFLTFSNLWNPLRKSGFHLDTNLLMSLPLGFVLDLVPNSKE